MEAAAATRGCGEQEQCLEHDLFVFVASLHRAPGEDST